MGLSPAIFLISLGLMSIRDSPSKYLQVGNFVTIISFHSISVAFAQAGFPQKATSLYWESSFTTLLISGISSSLYIMKRQFNFVRFSMPASDLIALYDKYSLSKVSFTASMPLIETSLFRANDNCLKNFKPFRF
uniref:Putative secreted protein n=1 Tax=Panstrongylus lignarius TaxID=156445 RepID=A0A224Y162_9HEMI